MKEARPQADTLVNQPMENAMALEALHHELLSFLKNEGATAFLINAWESAWYSAVALPGEPLPCPVCFLDGRVECLVPLLSVRDLGTARCEACKTKFEFYDG